MAIKYRGFIHGVIAGHGGVDENGVYQIQKPGTKQAKMPDGRMIYEGQENRYIRDEVLTQSVASGVKTIDLIPEVDDVSLPERMQRS